MDQQIEELKQLVRRNIELTQQTREEVHKMRKSARRATILRVLWFLTIIGVTGALYYYFIWPYVEQIQQLYGQVRSSIPGFMGGSQ